MGEALEKAGPVLGLAFSLGLFALIGTALVDVASSGPTGEVRLLAGTAPIATATIGGDRRPRLGLGETLVLGVGPGQTVELPESEPPDSRPWPVRHWTLTLAFALLTLTVVFATGTTGGPNHGEQPFIIAVIHGLAFLAIGPDWDRAPYGWLCVGAVVMGFVSMRHDLWEPAWRLWTLRLVNLALYAGLFAVIAGEPDFAPSARRAGDAVVGYVPARLRPATVEVRDGDDRVLASGAVPAGPDRRLVVFCGARAERLKIVGAGETIELPIRR